MDASTFAETPESIRAPFMQVLERRDQKSKADWSRTEAVLGFIASILENTEISSTSIDEALVRLKASELVQVIQAVLPAPEKLALEGTPGGVRIISGATFVAEPELSQVTGSLKQSLLDSSYIRKAASEVTAYIGNPDASSAVTRAGKFVRSLISDVRAFYQKASAQQTVLSFEGVPVEAIKGTYSVVLLEPVFRRNTQEYAQAIGDLKAQVSKFDGLSVNVTLLVPIGTSGLAGIPAGEREAAYRREHPEAADFTTILFSDAAGTVSDIRALVKGRFIAVTPEGFRFGTAASGDDAMMQMQLDSKAKTDSGVLVVATKLVVTGKDITLFGLTRIADHIYKYLPMLRPGEWIRILRQKAVEEVAAGTSA